MRLNLFLLSATLAVVSCNSNPQTPTIVDAANATKEPAKTEAAKSVITTTKKSNEVTTETASTTSNAGALSTESNNSAKAKKGWSKTAKGAVIGGVVGAGTGAVVNRKNRAVGAVVGGVAGAGAGAIIGNEIDKKDGRH